MQTANIAQFLRIFLLEIFYRYSYAERNKRT